MLRLQPLVGETENRQERLGPTKYVMISQTSSKVLQPQGLATGISREKRLHAARMAGYQGRILELCPYRN